jgi:hypothetical protein
MNLTGDIERVERVRRADADVAQTVYNDTIIRGTTAASPNLKSTLRS